MSKYKKEKGRFGESLVDAFFTKNRWEIYGKNIFFRGGEIDRVYYKNLGIGKNKYFGIGLCIAEVKYTQVLSLHHLETIFTDVYLAKFVKPRQMKNLKKFGENLERVFSVQVANLYLYARLFLVIEFVFEVDIAAEILKRLPGKVCAYSSTHLILSFEPEMVFGKASHPLQVSC